MFARIPVVRITQNPRLRRSPARSSIGERTRPTRSQVSLLSLLTAPAAQQQAPVCSDVSLTESAVRFTIRWPNSFRTERNHDAAWIVLRGADPEHGPLLLAETGHLAVGTVAATITRSKDRLGVFVAPAVPHRGDVQWQVTLALAEKPPAAVTPWAVGMVLVPAGAFELGDDEPVVVRHGSFHRVGDDGKPAGPLRIADEAEVRVAKHQTGRATSSAGTTPVPLPSRRGSGTKAIAMAG